MGKEKTCPNAICFGVLLMVSMPFFFCVFFLMGNLPEASSPSKPTLYFKNKSPPPGNYLSFWKLKNLSELRFSKHVSSFRDLESQLKEGKAHIIKTNIACFQNVHFPILFLISEGEEVKFPV